jgi:hypothetical protein
MSKGTQVYSVRLCGEQIAAISVYLQERREQPGVEPWQFSDFIRTAVREKLAKVKRGRVPHRRKGKGTVWG